MQMFGDYVMVQICFISDQKLIKLDYKDLGVEMSYLSLCLDLVVLRHIKNHIRKKNISDSVWIRLV